MFIITIETIYNLLIGTAIYLGIMITAPILYAKKNKINITRYIFPYLVLFCSQMSSILYTGYALELLDITTLNIRFPILSIIISFICLILPNIFVYLVSVRRHKIKIYEWILLNCYAAAPTLLFLLWGCIR